MEGRFNDQRERQTERADVPAKDTSRVAAEERERLTSAGALPHGPLALQALHAPPPIGRQNRLAVADSQQPGPAGQCGRLPNPEAGRAWPA